MAGRTPRRGRTRQSKKRTATSPNRAAEFTRGKTLEGFNDLWRINSKESLEHLLAAHTLTRMASCRTTLNPLLRLLAAATLLCWLGALALCSTECFEGDSDHHAGQKEIASSHSQDHPTSDSENHSGHDNSVCDSLKTLVPTAHNNVVPKPNFAFCFLSVVSQPQTLTVAECEAPVSRQPPDRDRVFTPEVSLGPAFRSHAPPVLL